MGSRPADTLQPAEPAPAWARIRSRRSVAIAAGAVAIVVAVAVLLVPWGSAESLTPALTRAEATRVLSGYTWANNQANDSLSSTTLATVEGGTSYAIDAGIFRRDKVVYAKHPSNLFPLFEPVSPRYYIPQLPASQYPRWFVVQTGQWYVLFSQASRGAPWLDTAEPNLLPGGGSAPAIATGSGGYAEAVTTADATGLGVAPDGIRRSTVTMLDGSGDRASAPSNLADSVDRKFWESQSGVRVYDQHQPGSGPVYGLRTADGGALLFYSVTARLIISPAGGLKFGLTIPGWYSGTSVSLGVLDYAEQFATYDPPAKAGGITFVGDYSGVVARG